MSRQTGADDAGLTTRSRSIQVGEFEVAIPGGNWVAIGEHGIHLVAHSDSRLFVVLFSYK